MKVSIMSTDFENRIRRLEQQAGGRDFIQRMNKIFSKGGYEQLSRDDVAALKKILPEKFELYVNELYQLTSANI